MRKLTKIMLAVVALATVAMSAQAIIAIGWRSSEGFYKNDGSTPLLNGGGTALAMLIFSPDNVVSGPTLDPSQSYVDPSETFLASWVVDASTSTYGEFSAAIFQDTYQAGYLYVRVFDEGSIVGGVSNVVPNMWYFDGFVTNTINNTSDPLNPNDYNISDSTGNFGEILNKQVPIPEPATWAFMGIGALAFFIRSRVYRG